jgi:hypothetical protein
MGHRTDCIIRVLNCAGSPEPEIVLMEAGKAAFFRSSKYRDDKEKLQLGMKDALDATIQNLPRGADFADYKVYGIQIIGIIHFTNGSLWGRYNINVLLL